MTLVDQIKSRGLILIQLLFLIASCTHHLHKWLSWLALYDVVDDILNVGLDVVGVKISLMILETKHYHIMQQCTNDRVAYVSKREKVLLQHKGNLTSDMIPSCLWCEVKIRVDLLFAVDLKLNVDCLITLKFIIDLEVCDIGRMVCTI